MNLQEKSLCQILQVEVPHPGGDPQVSVQGELTAWYAAPGETVSFGQLLYQISWPGVVIDYSAENSGVLQQQLIKLRQIVSAEDLVCEIQIA